jgi:hypothetical protein
LEFRNGINDRFPNLFKQRKANASSGYGWFATIDNLAKGDLTKFDDITRLPLMLCMTKLSLDTDRNIEKQKEIRKKQNMNKR